MSPQRQSPRGPRALLFAHTGRFAGARFEIGAEATLGRDVDNTVVLQDRCISARHCRIAYDEKRDEYLIEDLRSSNGTFVDGLRALGTEPLPALAVLNPGGAGDLIFHRPAAAPAQAAVRVPAKAAPPAVLPEEAPPALATLLGQEAPVLPALPVGTAPEASAEDPGMRTLPGLEPPPALPSLPAEDADELESTLLGRESPPLPAALHAGQEETPGHLGPEQTILGAPAPDPPPPLAKAPPRLLRVRFGDGWEETFELVEGPQEIGRSSECALYHPHQALSRHHARLFVENGRVWLTDLGSTNGTSVDERDLTPGEAVEILPGQRLAFGLVDAELVEAQPGAEDPPELRSPP